MRRVKVWSFGLASLAGAVVFVGGYLMMPDGRGPTPAHAAANAVTFPDIEKLVHYTTVERGQTIEHMLTTREALDAIQSGQPLPVGTHVVLQDFQSGKLYRYLVVQRMGTKADDYQLQWFWPDGTIKADENTAQCYSCHQSRQDRQFMFTFSDALSFGKGT